jgi:hypothetical protein
MHAQANNIIMYSIFCQRQNILHRWLKTGYYFKLPCVDVFRRKQKEEYWKSLLMMTVMRFSQRYCLVQEEFLNCLKLKTKTLRSIETSIIVYQPTRRNIPKHWNIFRNVFCNIQHAGIKRLLKCLYDVKRWVIRRLLIKKTHTHTHTHIHKYTYCRIRCCAMKCTAFAYITKTFFFYIYRVFLTQSFCQRM